MNRYNIQLKQEMKILNCFVGPVFVALAVVVFIDVKATMLHWTVLVCVIIFATFASRWSLKKYNKSIGSIVRSMEEINELKEEE